MSAKRNVSKGGMRVKVYDVLERAVVDGVAYGYRRAHKYTDKPDEEYLKEAIERAVMSSICDWFDFDDPNA
jgi:hypothetical protein